jgi:hypothetical protein
MSHHSYVPSIPKADTKLSHTLRVIATLAIAALIGALMAF